MSTHGQDSEPPRGRGIEMRDDYIDAAWKQRWTNARTGYPEDLIDKVGMVRGLFASPEAPSTEDQVFVVCRSDPQQAGAATLVDVYSSVPAANEHVLPLFAREYGASMGHDCSWSAGGQTPTRDLPQGSIQMVWSFSPHACLSLEIISPPGDRCSSPCKVWVDEKWVETEPSEALVRAVLG